MNSLGQSCRASRCCFFVDNPFGGCAIQLRLGFFQQLFGVFFVIHQDLLDGVAKLRPNSAVSGATNDILAIALLGRTNMWQFVSFSVNIVEMSLLRPFHSPGKIPRNKGLSSSPPWCQELCDHATRIL